MQARILVLTATLAFTSMAAEAQEALPGGEQAPPEVAAGGVATLVIKIPAPEGTDSAEYRLNLRPEFRPFLPLRGDVIARAGVFVIPITFAAPAGLPAGRYMAGTLELEAGETTLSRELVIEIRAQRSVHFSLAAEELTVPTDGTTGVPFRLANRGNIQDTVHMDARLPEGWTLLSAPIEILRPGDSTSGVLRIAASPAAVPGERVLIPIYGRTSEQELTQTARLVVVPADAWLGELAHVPSSLFIGQALGTETGPVLALSGEGRIGPETEVQVDFRHVDGVVDPALQRRMAGPRLRVTLDRPGLSVEAGDVYGFHSTISGSLRRAVGAQAEIHAAGPLSFSGTAALPTGFNGEIGDGHILYGEVGFDSRIGNTSLLVGDLVYPPRGIAVQTRSSGAGLRWDHDFGHHGGSIEATGVRFAAGDSIVHTGPAVDLEYGLNLETLTGRLRFRRTPGAVATHSGQGDEVSGSISARLTPEMYLVVWAYDVEQNRLASDTKSTSRTADVAVRSQLGRLQLQAGANVMDRATESAFTTFESRRRTLNLSATYTIGTLSLRSTAEVGDANEFGRDGPYRSVGTSVRTRGGERWGWMHVRFSQRPGGIESTSLNGGGEITFGPVDLSGGASWNQTGSASNSSLWVGGEIQALRNLSVHLGVFARPEALSDRWRFSLGISRRLNLPLPVRRQPDLAGVVFDDLNNNGVRDPGEPSVGGVTMELGNLSAVTNAGGRFTFREATGAPLRVRTERLPPGYRIHPETSLPGRGTAAVPLVRAATLTLDLFLDRDNDGSQDPAEIAGANVRVTATNDRGRQQSTVADTNGQARISGLLPGRYSITARPPSQRQTGGNPEVLMEIELAPGEKASVTLAVPLRQRTIRMGGQSGQTPLK